MGPIWTTAIVLMESELLAKNSRVPPWITANFLLFYHPRHLPWEHCALILSHVTLTLGSNLVKMSDRAVELWTAFPNNAIKRVWQEGNSSRPFTQTEGHSTLTPPGARAAGIQVTSDGAVSLEPAQNVARCQLMSLVLWKYSKFNNKIAKLFKISRTNSCKSDSVMVTL